jgi:hypothetical protein
METRGRKLKYPWDRAAAGEAIFIPAENPRQIISIRNAADQYAAYHDLIFNVTTEPGGVRVSR